MHTMMVIKKKPKRSEQNHACYFVWCEQNYTRNRRMICVCLFFQIENCKIGTVPVQIG